MYLSVMSVWELSLLDAKGRITLNAPCLDWVRTAIERSGAMTAPLTAEIAVECHRLPDGLHSDPVDRILVATARIEGLTLLTRDRAILDYAAKGHLRALPADRIDQSPRIGARSRQRRINTREIGPRHLRGSGRSGRGAGRRAGSGPWRAGR